MLHNVANDLTLISFLVMLIFRNCKFCLRVSKFVWPVNANSGPYINQQRCMMFQKRVATVLPRLRNIWHGPNSLSHYKIQNLTQTHCCLRITMQPFLLKLETRKSIEARFINPIISASNLKLLTLKLLILESRHGLPHQPASVEASNDLEPRCKYLIDCL